MAAQLPDSELAAEALGHLAGQIARLEELASGWDTHYAGTLSAMKTAIEELNREAFRRMIRALREDPSCAARLATVVRDPYVFGVLRFHGLVKDPVEHRVQQALEEVRPMLRTHGGDVELVAVKLPDTVEVRLVGACHGCPASSQTLTEGVERAVRRLCPEIQHIRQVSQPPPAAQRGNGATTHVVHFISPFARAADPAWQDLCALEDIPDGGVVTRALAGHDLLLYRHAASVSCFANACAHMGMPLDGGTVRGTSLECPYHGFTYDLTSGECLTVPEVQLRVHAVKVIGTRVSVRLEK